MLHQELGRERRAQIHREVDHYRLDARLAKAARSDEDGATRRGRVAHGAARSSRRCSGKGSGGPGGNRKGRGVATPALLLASIRPRTRIGSPPRLARGPLAMVWEARRRQAVLRRGREIATDAVLG